MFDRVVRSLFRLSAWILCLAFCLGLTNIIILANYMGTKTSFELLNFESMPLYLDKLLGTFFGVFLRNATMAHLFAFTVSLTTAFALFLLVHIGISLGRSFATWWNFANSATKNTENNPENREGSRTGNNGNKTTHSLQNMLIDIGFMVLLAIPTVLLIHWDIDLFRFRSVAGALGIDDPAIAPMKIDEWMRQLKEHGHLFAWMLAKVGAWGYFGANLVMSIALEYCGIKIGKSWTSLVKAFQEEKNNAQSNAPVENDLPRAQENIQQNINADANENELQEPIQVEPDGNLNFNHRIVNEEEGDALLDVISDRGMGRVSLQNALADNRYWVDPATREIWDADFRRRAMGDI